MRGGIKAGGGAVVLGLALLATAPVYAQTSGTYPWRPVRMIAPFPPAGPTDVLARAISVKLTEYWGQQVIVDNRPGAGGNIGTALAAQAPADGYTLVMGTIATHSINESVYPKLPYSPEKDFVAVALAAQTPSLVVVHPKMPVKVFGDLIAMAKAKPGELIYAHSGVGTLGHLAMELLTMHAGVKVTHVPYKGTGPALTDTIGGRTQFMISSSLSAAPHVRNNRLRAIAITSEKRSGAPKRRSGRRSCARRGLGRIRQSSGISRRSAPGLARRNHHLALSMVPAMSNSPGPPLTILQGHCPRCSPAT